MQTPFDGDGACGTTQLSRNFFGIHRTCAFLPRANSSGNLLTVDFLPSLFSHCNLPVFLRVSTTTFHLGSGSVHTATAVREVGNYTMWLFLLDKSVAF